MITKENLTIGTKVYIRDNLIPEIKYGANSYEDGMIKGQFVTICKMLSDAFYVEEDNILPMGIKFEYTPEMIDFEKTNNM